MQICSVHNTNLLQCYHRTNYQHKSILQIIQSNQKKKTFEQTLHQLYKFERINKNNINQPGTKYMNTITNIEQIFKTQFFNIQDDQDDRKIKMSGFYNDQLQNRMTGIKPHRAQSPVTKKAKAIINENFNDIEKNFKDFVENDKRIKSLRQEYQKICEENNIQKPVIQPLIEDNQFYLTEQRNDENSKNSLPSEEKFSQLRLRNDNNQKVMNNTRKQKEEKWAQLKARTKEKSFNIRKSRTKDLNGSLSKISTELPRAKVSSQLMKTQLNPRRPLNSTTLETAGKTGSTFYRPSSQKKI